MAKKGLRNSPSYKAGYKNYTNNDSWLKNKIRKLIKTVKNQPNNEVAKSALKVAENGKSLYTRNNKPDHQCKGLLNIFGFENNKSTKRTGNSYIWHTSQNYSKWFKASAPKATRYQNVKCTLHDAWLRNDRTITR